MLSRAGRTIDYFSAGSQHAIAWLCCREPARLPHQFPSWADGDAD
jgi:hypothetical protein